MKRRVPACVISGVTGAAGVRRHIITSARLNRSILRGLHFAVKIAQRDEGEHGGAGDCRDNEQPMPDGSRQAPHNSTRISSDNRKNAKCRQTVFVRSFQFRAVSCNLQSEIRCGVLAQLVERLNGIDALTSALTFSYARLSAPPKVNRRLKCCFTLSQMR